MRLLRVFAVAAVAAASLVPSAARAAVHTEGILCSLAGADSAADGTVTGELHGEFVVYGGAIIDGVQGGALTCTIQVDAPTHDGPDADAVTGPYSEYVAAASGSVRFALPPGATAYVCTSMRFTDGVVRYYDRSAAGSSNEGWTADPTGAPCDLAYVPPVVSLQCNDGIDNDGNGVADYPQDPGCTSSADNGEGEWAAQACNPAELLYVCLTADRTAEPVTYTAYLPDRAPAEVAAHLDVYRFALPAGGSADLPCVTVTGGPDACAQAGGTLLRRLASLGTGAFVPGGEDVNALATVRVCEAELVALVHYVGVSSFPAHTVC